VDTTPNKTCPACGSGNYIFRSRKKITPEPGQEGEEAIETKYRCKACEHEWRVKVPVKGGGGSAP
jgi:DNA-directed RNA polymerase subunit M/transcription elongation factor TFIIS